MATSADMPDACNKVIWYRLYARSLPTREGAGSSFLALSLKLIAATTLFTCFTWAPAFAMGRAGQTPSGQGTTAEPASQASLPVKAAIKDILAGSMEVTSGEVAVKGVFKGWNENCSSSSMITRSDWVLEDETGCIYVTGRIPNSLSPAKPRDENVLVQGSVIITKKGKPVIKASRITLLPK